MKAGAADYLTKGEANARVLERSIRYAVQRKRGEEEIRRLNAELEKRVQERTAQLEDLRESREHIRLLLESTAEAIYGVDLHGNCTFCNPVCVCLLGYAAPSDLLGKN